MKNRIVIGVTFPLIFAIAAIVIIPGKTQEQKPPTKAQPRRIDENRFPIADYAAPEPSDPAERSKRQA
jgi:hypothetical protein